MDNVSTYIASAVLQTRAKKRKLAKSYKSKARFAKLDLQQKEKAEAWKRFVSGKSGKKGKKK